MGKTLAQHQTLYCSPRKHVLLLLWCIQQNRHRTQSQNTIAAANLAHKPQSNKAQPEHVRQYFVANGYESRK